MRAVAVGVMAHNEAASILACLRAILAERPEPYRISSVVVVASGCTDGTEVAVQRLAEADDRIRLAIEPKRLGKATAINTFLAATVEPLCVLIGADIVISPGSMKKLLDPFLQGDAAMTGGRPVPTNRHDLIGNTVHVLWSLHHEVAIRAPKLGEAVAFRRVFDQIDADSLVDEVNIEALVLACGGHLRYIPEAVVYNHGPETLRDYLLQRRQIHLGHLRFRSSHGYLPSTMATGTVLRAVGALLRRSPRLTPMVLLTLILESIARLHAIACFVSDGGPSDGIWTPIVSSKQVVRPGHTLRRQVSGTIELDAVPDDRRLGRRSSHLAHDKKVLRSLVRAEDRCRIRHGHLRLVVHADAQSVPSITSRINGRLPGLLLCAPVVTSARRRASAS